MKQKLLSLASFLLLGVLGMSGVAWATNSTPQSSSPHYQVNEVFFGSGGELNSCSTNYCSKQSAGETAVGNTASSSYQAQAGFNTDRQPYLEFTVSNTGIYLGQMTSSTTKTANATFSVKTYLAGGYSVTQTVVGPTNGLHTLNPLPTKTASQTGHEQFGFNLTANTSPTAFGSDPTQAPDSTFGHGQVDDNYATANLYRYVSGDRIAYSTQSSGTTNYTISYIFNVSNATPAGLYAMYHVLIATSTF